ncbi:putative reverse transcriptase domain-containing protein [Tanacetum coccineum]
MAGSKGFPLLVAHIMCLYLSLDDRRGALREALSTDCELFVSVGEALKALDQWLCRVAGDAEEFIVGIVRPRVRREVVPLGGVVVDEVLLDRVFSLRITTVKSIPHSCRTAFSHALASALGKVAATPTSIEAWVKLLLLPRCTLLVFRPSNRHERRSGNRKSLQCHSIQRALIACGGDRFIKLIPLLFAQPLRVVSGKDDSISGSDSSTVGTNVKQCLMKVSDGHFTATVKVLCSSGVAPFGTDTLTALLAKHLILPHPVMPGSLPSDPPLVVDVDSVLGCGEGSAIAIGLLIYVVVNLLLEGRSPKVMAQFVAFAPLTVLLKPDNGIRSIAEGVIWRRLASKVAIRGVRKEMSKYLRDFQFRVGVPSGAEAVLHGANRFLNKFHSDGSLAMLTVDFSNAFNLVDQTTLLHEVQTRCPSISLWVDFLYGQSARLYVGDDHICSTTRVQQGDPLGPLLFALEGLFPNDIGRLTLGVKLLGGEISRDAGFISSLAVKRASRAMEQMSLLPSLQDPQSELLLLRSCMSVAKLLFGLRTCQPMYIGEAVSIFNNGLRRAIEAIVVCEGPFFGDFQWRLASLPIWFGGLGLCSAEDVSTYAFVASRAQSWSLQDHILQGCGIDRANSDYRYALDRVRIECLRAPRAQSFLTVIPIEGLGQHMLALEYRTILKYRLMIPLFPVDEPCPVCRKVCLDSFGEHAVHCKELPSFKYRQDLARAAGGKHACVDLTEVSPLVGLRDNGFVARQAALKAKSSKVVKHEKACLENQHVFIAFAFDTFGFLAPEAEEFLTRVQRVVQSNFSTLKTQNFIFSRIGFAIQKEVVAHLVARFPTILL